MHRRRRRTIAHVLAAILPAFAVGCGGSSEGLILEDFFRASRLQDTVTLASVATTGFDPLTDGIVTSFDVVSVSDERSVPMPIGPHAREADEVLSGSRRLAELSLARVQPPVEDVTQYAGELVRKDVIVDATVRTPEGATERRTLEATLMRAVLSPDGNEAIQGRWLVTSVRESAGIKPS